MSAFIEVRFKGHRQEYFQWTGEDPLRPGEPVIVEAERGKDLGRVSAVGPVAEKKCVRCQACSSPATLAGGSSAKRILRRATPDDLLAADRLRAEEDGVRRSVRERARAHTLAMKISDAEWQWDRQKLTVYFTAEQRVDFRALVRDLAAQFRTRIELHQIGARDEARRLSGVGRCGREYCSASWLTDLRPVGLAVAKDQHLSLNPSQISGPCGRLLCCLHYEHDFYVQSRRRFPKEGKALRTSVGAEKVLAIDIFRERVTLRSEEGSTRVVPLAQLTTEVEAQGGKLPLPVEPAPHAPALVPAPGPAVAGAAPGAPPVPAPGGSGRRRKRRDRRRKRGGGGGGSGGGEPNPGTNGGPAGG